MAKKLDRKEETRQRMLEAASKSFRSHGFVGIGVDGIARAAGVTSGAFYAHFGSKERAFGAAIEVGLNEVIEALPKFQRDFGVRWVQAFSDYYLSQAHREDLACGCAMTTLSPEVVRANPQTHVVYEAKMEKIVDLVADGLAGGSKSERRTRAWSMLGVLIGGLTMARAVRSPQVAQDIAASTCIAAVNTAGIVRDIRPNKTEE